MKMSEFFLAQLEREAVPTRRVLERVPAGKDDWRPHPKSMQLGYLATLVAVMPSWIEMMLASDEHDIMPPGGGVSPFTPQPGGVKGEALAVLLDRSVAAAAAALRGASEERFLGTWRMLVGGQTVSEQVRHVAIADAVFSHLAHHRGQLTVYLRLNEVPVPAVYGPSADEGQMG